jgi:hypothetical protein
MIVDKIYKKNYDNIKKWFIYLYYIPRAPNGSQIFKDSVADLYDQVISFIEFYFAINGNKIDDSLYSSRIH